MSPAPKICAHPRCPNVQPCPIHKPKPWASSSSPQPDRIRGRRRQRRVRFILSRDEGRCHLRGEPGADVADHVIPLAEGGADTVDNLKAAHSACNAAKAQREAQRGRERQENGR